MEVLSMEILGWAKTEKLKPQIPINKKITLLMQRKYAEKEV
jgi:hypothetical protein